MTSIDASETEHIREGSSLYYSLLWTETSAKRRFGERLALLKAMATTLDDVQEPQVAEKKIHWWHEELQRLTDGVARHPATRQNQKALAGLASAQSACLEIVSVASTQRFTPPATTADRDEALTRSFLARLALLSHALSDDENDLDPASHSASAALAFAQHDQLARLPMLIHRGLPVFSDELYKAFNVRPVDLAEHIRVAPGAENADASLTSQAPTPALKSIPIVTEKSGRQQLIAHAIKRNHTVFVQAMNDPHTSQRYRKPPLLPLWRLLVLRKSQLDLWTGQPPDLLRERTALTPLAKFWYAWRNKR